MLPKVDLVLTDPPYGIGFASQPTDYQRKRGQPRERWDNSTFQEIDMVRDKGAVQIIWGGNYYILPPSRGWLCWYKPDGPPSFSQIELAWTSLDKNSQIFTRTISATNAERVGHPTQKPLPLMTWCLSLVPDAQTILDPFAGSGTTLVAAKQLGRKSIGIELEEKYCEVAARRLSQEYIQFTEEPEKPIQQEALL